MLFRVHVAQQGEQLLVQRGTVREGAEFLQDTNEPDETVNTDRLQGAEGGLEGDAGEHV